jgi:hypothetical protein
VRSHNVELGKQKLQNSLESYLLWDESLSQRIIPLIGDLSEPLLGLDPEEFQLMASKLDVIYHNGALVNFVYPYQALKKLNVLGTQEILRLASQVKLKPVHFISTASFNYLSQQSSSLGKAFHLRNPQSFSLRTMAQYLCYLGYPVESVNYDQWRSQLVNHPDSAANALYPLISTFTESNIFLDNSQFFLETFDSYVRHSIQDVFLSLLPAYGNSWRNKHM